MDYFKIKFEMLFFYCASQSALNCILAHGIISIVDKDTVGCTSCNMISMHRYTVCNTDSIDDCKYTIEKGRALMPVKANGSRVAGSAEQGAGSTNRRMKRCAIYNVVYELRQRTKTVLNQNDV